MALLMRTWRPRASSSRERSSRSRRRRRATRLTTRPSGLKFSSEPRERHHAGLRARGVHDRRPPDHRQGFGPSPRSSARARNDRHLHQKPTARPSGAITSSRTPSSSPSRSAAAVSSSLTRTPHRCPPPTAYGMLNRRARPPSPRSFFGQDVPLDCHACDADLFCLCGRGRPWPGVATPNAGIRRVGSGAPQRSRGARAVGVVSRASQWKDGHGPRPYRRAALPRPPAPHPTTSPRTPRGPRSTLGSASSRPQGQGGSPAGPPPCGDGARARPRGRARPPPGARAQEPRSAPPRPCARGRERALDSDEGEEARG